ncbi:MAG: NlpC/P60 family protein [Verrucomicrobiota bacterium]
MNTLELPDSPFVPAIGRRSFLALLAGAALGVGCGNTEAARTDPGTDSAITSSLEIDDLAGSKFWPEHLRSLITYALSLTPRGLGYQFGSSEPDAGGMDCSGTLYHVMRHEGVKKVPRASDGMFNWVKEAGLLNAVSGTPEQDDPILARMRPGDLLFWTGTYDTGSRATPISHVMMYIGKTTAGEPVMFGASDGRPYRGKRQNGVSVFDFRMPKAEKKARFVGYGPIPGFDVSNIPPQPPTQGRPADYGKGGTSDKTPASSPKKESGATPPSKSPKENDGGDEDDSRENDGGKTPEKTPSSAKRSGSRKASDSKKSSTPTKRPATRKKRSTSKD